MALLTGMTEDGREVPVQVDGTGRLVAEGLQGLPGPSQINPGGAATPGLSVTGDSDTGIYVPGPNAIGVAVGGIAKLYVGEKVGINTTAPGAVFDVKGNVHVGRWTGKYQGITLINGDNSAASETISYVEARNNLDVSDAGLYITHWPDGGSNMMFETSSPGDRATDRRMERVRITKEGDLLIAGQTNATAPLALTRNGELKAVGVSNRVHPDNAAARAAGLLYGDFYRKPDGTLMIAF